MTTSMTTARILVVDDEPQIRRVMRMALSAEGYEAYEAKTGEAALNDLRTQRFDLVLLDMNLPGMGGIEACRAIRANSDIAVVMLTVRNREEDKVAALDAGADDYVTKPFSTPELLARIRASLRRVPLTSESTAGRIVIGDLDINVAGRRLTSKGQEVRLTPKEYDLLLYLVSAPKYDDPARKAAPGCLGPGLRRRNRISENVCQSTAQEARDRSRQAEKYIITEPWVGYRFQTC